MRERFAALGLLDENVTDDQLREIVAGIGRSFRDDAPTTAEQAATIILDGVREERWRILVGDDAHRLDEMVREYPEEAYSEGFLAKLRERVEWNLGRLGCANTASAVPKDARSRPMFLIHPSEPVAASHPRQGT